MTQYRSTQAVTRIFDHDKEAVLRGLLTWLAINDFVISGQDERLGIVRARYDFPGASTWQTAQAQMRDYTEPIAPYAINPYGKNPFVSVNFRIAESRQGSSRVSVRAHFQTWGEPRGVDGVGPFSMNSKLIWEKELLDRAAGYILVSKQAVPRRELTDLERGGPELEKKREEKQKKDRDSSEQKAKERDKEKSTAMIASLLLNLSQPCKKLDEEKLLELAEFEQRRKAAYKRLSEETRELVKVIDAEQWSIAIKRRCIDSLKKEPDLTTDQLQWLVRIEDLYVEGRGNYRAARGLVIFQDLGMRTMGRSSRILFIKKWGESLVEAGEKQQKADRDLDTLITRIRVERQKKTSPPPPRLIY